MCAGSEVVPIWPSWVTLLPWAASNALWTPNCSAKTVTMGHCEDHESCMIPIQIVPLLFIDSTASSAVLWSRSMQRPSTPGLQ